MIVTGKVLQLIVPTLALSRAEMIAEHIDYITPLYNMKRVDVLHEFIAQAAHESGGFRLKTENLNYKTAERIMATWPTRFKTRNVALPYVGNAQRLANSVYANRMGNKHPDDGFIFRGGGFIQITGREMYEAYQKYVKFESLQKLADAVRTDDYWAMDSACWFFAVVKNLVPLAIGDSTAIINPVTKKSNFLVMTERINGGRNGLRDREWYYERAKRFLV